MANQELRDEIFQLPEQIHQARLAVLQAEQQCMSAELYVDELKAQH